MNNTRESPSGNPTPTPQHTRCSEEWRDGDFEAITADSVRFLVPSYHLFVACSLFRDAESFTPPYAGSIKYTVTLMDLEFETEAVFKTFLKLIVNLPLSGLVEPAETLEFKRLSGLFKFMNKWGCSQSLHRILHHNLASLVGDNHDMTILVFVVGAYMDDQPLCMLGLREYHRQRQGGRSWTEPASWPIWVWEAYPSPYLAAAHNPSMFSHWNFDEVESRFMALVLEFKQQSARYSAS